MRVGNAYGDTTLYIGNSKEVMMNKYIVKNCPAYDLWKPTHSCVSSYSKCVCERNADCLIKQVIEKCRDYPFSACACGDEILQLFEIEEVEDED